MNKGKLFVISGPSGVGKGTICKQLIEDIEDLSLSVSMTTRAPREGEVDGVNYFFVSHEEFEYQIAHDGLFEYAQRYENYYGTPKAKVIEQLEQGKDIMLEIEMDGALKVKKDYPEAILIFILPPSLAELRRRLEGRGTETAEAIEMRLSNTVGEIEYMRHYDYYVFNDELAKAIGQVEHIMEAEHARAADSAEAIINRFKEEL